MSRKKQERRAAEVARSLNALRRIQGIPVVEGGELWLLSRVAPPADIEELADLLLARALPSTGQLAEILKARELIRIDAGRLGKWSYDVSKLESHDGIEKLTASGLPALRSFRKRNLRAFIAEGRAGLDRLSRLQRGLRGLGRGGGNGEPALALSLRLHALGNWSNDDPLQQCLVQLEPRPELDEALLAEIRDAGSDGEQLRLLAALLLGFRHRVDAEHQRSAIAGRLPTAELGQAFELGRRRWRRSPLLLAHWLQAGLPLPEGATAPGAPLREIDGIAERVAVIRGAAAAHDLFMTLIRPWAGGADDSRRRGRLLHRFGVLLRRFERTGSLRARQQAERRLALGLRRLPQRATPGARQLARLFIRWMEAGGEGGEERPLSLAQLAGAAHAGLRRGGLVEAATALTGAWEQAARSRVPQLRPGPSVKGNRARLIFRLDHPGPGLDVPGSMSTEQVERLVRTTEDVPSNRLRALWAETRAAVIGQSHPPWGLATLLRSSAPPELVRRALRLGAVQGAAELCDSPMGMAGYLDCLETLRADEHWQATEESPFDKEWFIGLFRAGRRWATNVAVALLSHRRARKSVPDNMAALHALGQALGAGAPALAEALDRWDRPGIGEPPAELDRLHALLSEAAQVSREELVTYLHHRRLAGQGASFSTALLEPLRLQKKEAAETRAIADRLEQLAFDDGIRDRLQKRLAALTDEAQRVARMRTAAQRAAHRLRRALARLKRESLEQVLDDVVATELESLLGRRLGPGEPKRLRKALHLLHAESLDRELFKNFLLDVSAGKPLALRPANARWLDGAAARGVDVAAWQRGVDVTVTLDGDEIRFATEHDPLHALEMGSYFDTCLDLAEGFNAASTLVNAMDINKQVIYGRRRDGAVVARKLIGATQDGKLAGYNTYSLVGHEQTRRALAETFVAFAGSCRLELDDRATPEVIHKSFWYDDGNEAWQALGHSVPLPEPPGDLPDDGPARCEHSLAEAWRQSDVERMLAVANQGVEPWSGAALVRLAGARPDLLRQVTQLPCSRWALQEFFGDVVSGGAGAALAELPWVRASQEYVDQLVSALAVATPWSVDAQQQALRRIRAFAGRKPAPTDRFYYQMDLPVPHWAYGALPTQSLVALLRALLRMFESDEAHLQHWINCAVDLVLTAYLRDGDSAPIVAGLKLESRPLQQIMLGVTLRQAVAGSEPHLRSMLRRCAGSDRVQVALALGKQGDPRDAERLLTLLREAPAKLELAVAVVRCGESAAAEEARKVWLPPARLDDMLAGTREMALVAELGSRRFARRLGRYLSRLRRSDSGAADHGRQRLARLALPSPEGDPGGSAAHKLWGRCRDLRGLIDGLPRAEPAAASVLDECRLLLMATAVEQARQDPDEALVGAMWLALARGDLEQKTAALRLWPEVAGQTLYGGRPWGLLAVLAGDDRRGLPEELRVSLAREAASAMGKLSVNEQTELLLTWLDGCDAGVVAEQLQPVTIHDYAAVPLLDAAARDSAAPGVAQVLLKGSTERLDDLCDMADQARARTHPDHWHEELAPLFQRMLTEQVEQHPPSVSDLMDAFGRRPQETSYRVEELVLRYLTARQPELCRELTGELRKAPRTPRVRWMLGLLGTQ